MLLSTESIQELATQELKMTSTFWIALFSVLEMIKCYDLAKWLSHYLYFFSFLFLFFYLGLTTQKEVQESITL